jgi:polyisoprenoid-binding protein YceI
MASGNGGRHWWRWIGGGVVAVAVLVFGGAFVYIHFIQGPAPAPFALSTSTASSTANGGPLTARQVDGTWKIASGSVAGYRVQEVLAGQNNTAVGRGTGVTGSWQISGDTITKGAFTVDLTTVTSDSGQRDSQFNGRIMDTAQFPDATFTLTKPITLGSIPNASQPIKINAVGTLTMHGVTKPVTASLEARDSGSEIDIVGTIPVLFSNWNIANPSFSGFVTTKNNGTVEFSLKTTEN